jgi:hypothetical protein
MGAGSADAIKRSFGPAAERREGGGQGQHGADSPAGPGGAGSDTKYPLSPVSCSPDLVEYEQRRVGKVGMCLTGVLARRRNRGREGGRGKMESILPMRRVG